VAEERLKISFLGVTDTPPKSILLSLSDNTLPGPCRRRCAGSQLKRKAGVRELAKPPGSEPTGEPGLEVEASD
jgi:hypothetical protein